MDGDGLFGRDIELGRADAVLARLGAGVGGVIAVTGPVGVGKTAFAEEVRRRAASTGTDVVVGRSYRFQSGLSYAPLVDALGRIVRDDAPSGPLVRDLTSLGLLFDGIPPGPVHADPALGRTRLATALVTLVHRLADRRPTMVLLDDVQWADEATVALLPHLAADIESVALLLVLVHRADPDQSTESGADRAGQAVRGLAGVEIRLGPLSRADVARLVRSMLGQVYPRELDDIVFERSGGTPLFARDIVTTLIERGGLVKVAGGWRLDADHLPGPASGVESMRARVAGCSPAELSILAPLAVHGAPIDERVLVSLGIDATLLRSLVTRHLVTEERRTRQRSWRLAHPVLADLVVGELGDDETEAWHERLARAFAAIDPDRFAQHLLHAGDRALRVAGSAEELAQVFVAAADRTERQGSMLAATRFLTAALDLTRATHPIPLHAGATARLAHVWSERGHHELAAELAQEAVDEYLLLGDVRAAVDVSAVPGEIRFYLDDPDLSWLRPVVDAACASGDDEVLLRARYLEHFVRTRRFGVGDPTELRRLARNLADRRDIGTFARGVLATTEFSWSVSVPERVDVLRDAAIEADGEPWIAERCWNVHLDLCLALGDWGRVNAALEAIAGFTERHGRLENWRVRVAHAQQLLFSGRPQAAAEVEVFYRGAVSHNPRVGGIALLLQASAHAALGDRAALERCAAEARDLRRRTHDRDVETHRLIAAVLACAAAGLDDRALAASVSGGEPMVLNGTPLLGPIAHARAAIVAGDRTTAEKACSVLRRLDPSGCHQPGATAALLEAQLLMHLGEEVDDGPLVRAAEVFERLGMAVAAAEVALVRHLAGTVSDDELAGVASRLRADIDLDAGAIGERIDARLGGRVSRALRDDTLSQREREVAELVSEGLTNREVADRLFISVRTVTSHLDHIYTKLGIGSRKELAQRLRS